MFNPNTPQGNTPNESPLLVGRKEMPGDIANKDRFGPIKS
jgi:hypothetical protein